MREDELATALVACTSARAIRKRLPPPVAGSARIDSTIAFDKAAGGFSTRLGAATPDERVFSVLGPDGEPQLFRRPPTTN